MRGGELGVVRVLVEIHRGIGHVPQPREVEDLHPVFTRVVRHDEGVVGVDLHVAPQVGGRPPGEGKVPEIDGIPGVRHVDEGGPVESSEDRVLASGLRVHPAPDVAHHDPARAADFTGGEEGDEVHLGAVEAGDRTVVGASHLFARDRGQAGLALVDGGGCAPRAAGVPLEHEPDALEELGAGGPDHGEAVASGHRVAHESHQPPCFPLQYGLFAPLAVVPRAEDVRCAREGVRARRSYHESPSRPGERITEEGRRRRRRGPDRPGLGPRPVRVRREAENGPLRLVGERRAEERLAVLEHCGQAGHDAAGRRQTRDLIPRGPGSAEHVARPCLRRGRRGELAERERSRGAHQSQVALHADGGPETGVRRGVGAGELDGRQAHVGLDVGEHGTAGPASRRADDAELRAGPHRHRGTEGISRHRVRRLEPLQNAPPVAFANEDVCGAAALVLLRRAHHQNVALDGQRLPETVSVHAARRRYGRDLRPSVRAAAEYMDAAGFRTGHRERSELPRPRDENLVAGDGRRRPEADDRGCHGIVQAAGVRLRRRRYRHRNEWEGNEGNEKSEVTSSHGTDSRGFRGSSGGTYRGRAL